MHRAGKEECSVIDKTDGFHRYMYLEWFAYLFIRQHPSLTEGDIRIIIHIMLLHGMLLFDYQSIEHDVYRCTKKIFTIYNTIK